MLLFNRPDCARRLAEALSEVKPQVLYVACDGPRRNRDGEAKLVEESLAIFRHLSWRPQIFWLIRDENLGCRAAVSSAIDWFFREVDAGIILEDDCIPSASFFEFCRQTLEIYRDDAKVFSVSGSNLLGSFDFNGDSFGFSKYPHVWGWASWRRAWAKYDVNMANWPRWRDQQGPRGYFQNQELANYWSKFLEMTYQNQVNTWDYQWAFAMWMNEGLSVTPRQNLIQNIGFDQRATHTKNNEGLSLVAGTLTMPLRLPMAVEGAVDLDSALEEKFYREKTKLERVVDRIQKAFS